MHNIHICNMLPWALQGMTRAPELPQWLENRRIPDEEMAAAYNELPRTCRAAIKTAISLAHFHFGADSRHERRTIFNPHAGMWNIRSKTPLAWAIIAFDANFSAAAKLCAAACLPALANVGAIIGISIGKPGKAALATLELCGVEDIFNMTDNDFHQLLSDIKMQKNCPGKIIFLHQGQLDDLTAYAANIGISFYDDKTNIKIHILHPQYFAGNLLKFTLGFEPDPDRQPDFESYDAIYYNPSLPDNKEYENALADYPSRLYLTPGCEGFWIFPDLGIDRFFVQNNAFGLVEKREDSDPIS